MTKDLISTVIYSSQERTYTLKSTLIPPEKYDRFLHDVVEQYRAFARKELDIDPEGTFSIKDRRLPAVYVETIAHITGDRYDRRDDGIPTKFSREVDFPKGLGTHTIDALQANISELLDIFSQRLEQEIPARAGKIPSPNNKTGNPSRDNYDIHGIRFGFRVVMKKNGFESSLVLHDNGMQQGAEDFSIWEAVPAITVMAKQQGHFESESVERKLINLLEPIVLQYYPIMALKKTSSEEIRI